jgi:hypothetical protein
MNRSETKESLIYEEQYRTQITPEKIPQKNNLINTTVALSARNIYANSPEPP